MPLSSTPLHDGWTLRPVAGPVPEAVRAAGPVPATVPGTVHTDLLAAGLVPDPHLDDHEHLLSWIGLCDWAWTATVVGPGAGAGERHELVFTGLDTVATVELDGTVLARTANMHRTYRVDVTDVLHEGPHDLTVTFASAVRHADRASLELGARPHVNHHPYNAIRKMACNFGWDWGPDLVTAGIWRPVRLESWRTARLASVRPVVSFDGGSALVHVHVDVERLGDADLEVTATVGGVARTVVVPPGAGDVVVPLRVEQPRLWWPRDYGEQPLYDLEVTLAAGGEGLDAWHGRVGLRTVELDTTPDEHGTRFALVVNGTPVFVKGANWIPDDTFPHRVGRERYAARIAQAEEAGCNLLRVWGGGTYESDDFYAECDERGVMVWQDFLFACAAYAEEEPLRSEVEAEARDNVARLAVHPSLVAWCGCNENLWGHEDWEWKERLDGRTWGSGYYHDLLPGIVAHLDPGRPYLPGSPFSPAAGAHPNDPAHGPMHVWDVWNQLDWTVYRDYSPRFVAEFGWQGPPTWATLRRGISDDPLTPESPGMLVHQKAVEGNRKLVRGLVPHLPVPDDMDDWHWAMSLNQARAVAAGVEHFRALSPTCTGSIVWQLNDCWPVTSWAVVDGDGRRKPVFYALQHAHRDRLLTLQPAGGLAAVLVNDTAEPWAATVVLQRLDVDGEHLAETSVDVQVPPRATHRVPLPPRLATPGSPARELVVARAGADRAVWFFAEDRDLELPEARLRVRTTPTPDGASVEVVADTLVRDLALLVDKVHPDAVVDEMLVTLLPGETATFEVATSRPLTAADLGPRVLRSANQLLARPAG